MSLKRFVKLPECTKLLAPLKPPVNFKIEGKVKIQPASNRYSLIGTAFDYLLRFELQRRAPYAIASQWIAASSIDAIHPNERVWLDMFPNAEDYLSPQEVLTRIQSTLDRATLAYNSYLGSKTPSRTDQLIMAGHALLLAKLDIVVRARKLDKDFEEVKDVDKSELVELLNIVPINELLHPSVIILNPRFGSASQLVNGADADLIVGNTLIDLKTTKDNLVDQTSRNQLLGYYLLARRHRVDNPSFPEINKVAIYFSRHGCFWTMNVDQWTSNPIFSEIENKFFLEAVRLRKDY